MWLIRFLQLLFGIRVPNETPVNDATATLEDQ